MHQILEVVRVQHSDTTATNIVTYFRGEFWTSTHCTVTEVSTARLASEAIPLGPIGSSGVEVTS